MLFWLLAVLLVAILGSLLAATRPANRSPQRYDEAHIGYQPAYYSGDAIAAAIVSGIVIVVAAALWIGDHRPAAVGLLFLLILAPAAAFKREVLAQNDLLFLVQGKSLVRTWRGEADVYIARWNNVVRSSVGFQAAQVPAAELTATAADGVPVNIQLGFAYTITPREAANDFARAFWRLGPLDSIKNNQAVPQAKMAAREIAGRMTAMELASSKREEARAAMAERMKELFTGQQLNLLGLTLGEITIDPAFHTEFVRALAEAHANIHVHPSLTPSILEHERIQALRDANTVIVPSGEQLHLVTHGQSPAGTESPR